MSNIKTRLANLELHFTLAVVTLREEFPVEKRKSLDDLMTAFMDIADKNGSNIKDHIAMIDDLVNRDKQ